MSSYIKNILFVLILISSQANAVLYKNPVTNMSDNQKSIGVFLFQGSRDVTSDAIWGGMEADQTLIAASLTIGLDNKSAIELRLGLDDSELDGSQGSDGILLGAIYRFNFPSTGKDLKMGAFASAQTSTLSNDNDDTDVNVYEFGLGMSKKIGENMDIYAGGVLSMLEGTIYTAGPAYDFESSDDIGFFVGMENQLQDNMKFGLEFNIMHQTSFAAYIEMPF